MKTVTADLSDEGRQDILERVRSYRGGASLWLICVTIYTHFLLLGYTPEVRAGEHVLKSTLKTMLI